MNGLTIRLETEQDYRAVEELTREAFWNVYKPGADEHYFVHRMRNHPDFIPELAFVLEFDGKIIGNIMYTKAWLEDEDGNRKEILSFGPLCVAPEYQRQKLGKILIEHSFDAARKMGYDVNINFGNPGNYVSRGQLCRGWQFPDGSSCLRACPRRAGRQKVDVYSQHRRRLLRGCRRRRSLRCRISPERNEVDAQPGGVLHLQSFFRSQINANKAGAFRPCLCLITPHSARFR